MKYIIILSLFFLIGCSTTTPVKHSFPLPPSVIIEKCSDLTQMAKDEEKLSEFLKIVIANYSLYHECASKHDMLVKWLAEQKNMFDEVFNKGN